MPELKTASQLAREAGLSDSTTRRYLEQHKEFFAVHQRGKKKLYPEKATGILEEIAHHFSRGLTTPQVKEMLQEKYGQAGPPGLEGTHTPAGKARELEMGLKSQMEKELSRMDSRLAGVLEELEAHQKKIVELEGSGHKLAERNHSLENQVSHLVRQLDLVREEIGSTRPGPTGVVDTPPPGEDPAPGPREGEETPSREAGNTGQGEGGGTGGILYGYLASLPDNTLRLGKDIYCLSHTSNFNFEKVVLSLAGGHEMFYKFQGRWYDLSTVSSFKDLTDPEKALDQSEIGSWDGLRYCYREGWEKEDIPGPGNLNTTP